MKQSISREQIRDIAARVVEALLNEPGASAAALKEFSQADSPASPAVFYSPWTGETLPASTLPTHYLGSQTFRASHASQHQFNILEAADPVVTSGALHDFIEAQRCSMEKGKACDYCGACRMLGF